MHCNLTILTRCTHLMLQNASRGPEDCWDHGSFALWMYVNGLTSFLYDLNTWSAPSRPQSSHSCVRISQFWQGATSLCCKAHTMDLMMMIAIPGSTPSRPQSSHGCVRISQFWQGAPLTLYCKALPVYMVIAAAMFHLPCVDMALDWQAFYII